MLSSKQLVFNLGDQITTRSTKSAYMTGQSDQHVDSTIYHMTRQKYRNTDISICNYVLWAASNRTKSKLEGKKDRDTMCSVLDSTKTLKKKNDFRPRWGLHECCITQTSFIWHSSTSIPSPTDIKHCSFLKLKKTNKQVIEAEKQGFF